MKVRFGAAITVARPRLDELGGGASYNVIDDDGTPKVVDGQEYFWERNGGGNPKLKPWKANAYDLSFEKYFGENKGYVSAAIYYKDLDTYIFNRTTLEDFSGLPLPEQDGPLDQRTYDDADAKPRPRSAKPRMSQRARGVMDRLFLPSQSTSGPGCRRSAP
jgi:outer membrane receptor protein involved in Fe transport